MKRCILKCIWLAALVLLFSFSGGIVVSGSDVGNVVLSYDVVERSTAGAGDTSRLTVRLKIKNVGEGAIDKVTARVAGTEGVTVSFDGIFFGLIESGETIASDSFDIIVGTGNSQDDRRHGIAWEVEYWTRYGIWVVEKGWTYL